MRRSITARLVAMFALATLATFAIIGAALYGVLDRELLRHQNDDLNTNLQNMRYSIERFGDLEHWARLQVKMDTLSPADGSELVARAKTLKMSGSIGVATVEVFSKNDAGETLCAFATATMRALDLPAEFR